MSFFNTPLKHGRGVNKPFRSPLIKGDQNDSTSGKQSTPSRLNQNSKIRSLGFKSPINSRGFNSPMKPLLLTSPSKDSDTGTLTKCTDYSSPLKRIENNLLLKRSRNNSLKLSYDDSSLKTSEIKLHMKSSEKDLSVKSTEFTTNVKNENLDDNILRNDSQTINEKKDLISNEETSFESFELKKTPPISPKIQQAIDSPEYQPVVKLQRLSPNIVNIYKKDLALLMQRVKDKKREMVELRVKLPLERKHNLEEIVVSIGKWREAFTDALETLRESLIEKHGRYFGTSDVLKLLSIPNSIVHFSEEMNDFIIPKI